MGLEALVALLAQGQAVSVSSRRPFGPLNVGADGFSYALYVRESSDSAESSSFCVPSKVSLRHSSVLRASAAGGEGTGPEFPSRDPGNDRGLEGRGPWSSSLRAESLWSFEGFPGRSGPSGFFRWRSEGMKPKTAKSLEDFPGRRSGRRKEKSGEVETFDHETMDTDLVDSSIREEKAFWRGSSRGDSSIFETVWIGDRERDNSGISTEASAVDVTTPSFVHDIEFMERREHLYPQGILNNSTDLSFAGWHTDEIRRSGLDYLQSKAAAVSTSPDEIQQPRANTTPVGLGGRTECESISVSFQNLTKRNERGTGEGISCAIKRAFGSMLFMIEALQTYTLHMYKILCSETDVRYLVSLVHTEMHSSFLWLFQQVFSCTPTLMVSVMILLANFTVFSLGNDIARGVVVLRDPPTQLISILQSGIEPIQPLSDKNSRPSVYVDKSSDSSPGSVDSVSTGLVNDGSGGSGRRSVIVASGADGNFRAHGASDRRMFSERESNSLNTHSASAEGSVRENMQPVFLSKLQSLSSRTDKGSGSKWTATQPLDQEEISYQSLLEQTARELELKKGKPHHVELDEETLRRLIDPLSTKIQCDGNFCFDQTDLEYQQAISTEPANPMLLANYAQFLYAVRHDNNRAETFFHQALRTASKDGDIVGQWATFLWLALKDRPRADKAYRAAIALDPSNPFHAGSYTHFLWHADDCESPSCQLGTPF